MGIISNTIWWLTQKKEKEEPKPEPIKQPPQETTPITTFKINVNELKQLQERIQPIEPTILEPKQEKLAIPETIKEEPKKYRCMKCRANQEIKEPLITEIKSKGGSIKKRISGLCVVCNSKVSCLVKGNELK